MKEMRGETMSMINVSNLTFAYEGSYDDIFENVSFQIDTDWKLGFIGRNGRGKTTFLNLLLGKYSYSGTISTDRKFEYFPYEVEDKKEMTISVVQNICPECEDWEIMKEVSLLEVDVEALYRPFETLSNGEQTKVLLAALFLGSSKYLLIDEPTNHLDVDGRKVIGNYLKRKKGFILVSHDRNLLDGCVDHILSINKTNIEIQSGNFSSWWHNKQLQDDFELAENEKLKKEIGRLSAASKRSANWSDQVEKSKIGQTNSGSKLDRGFVGHKAAKMMKRAKSLESRQKEAMEQKSRLLHNIEEHDSLKLAPLKYMKDVLVEARDLSLFYGEMCVCRDIRMEVHQGDRIAITGKNGCGKSTFLKAICGRELKDKTLDEKQLHDEMHDEKRDRGDIKYNGTLRVGSGLKISYVSQDTSHLRGSLTDYAWERGIDESLFKTILRKLGFERVQFEKDMADFSGGQKKKVLIAASLSESAHLYVWDEPLNFLDVFSRMQIEELILEYKPTLLFVEHDVSFQEKIATKVCRL